MVGADIGRWYRDIGGLAVGGWCCHELGGSGDGSADEGSCWGEGKDIDQRIFFARGNSVR